MQFFFLNLDMWKSSSEIVCVFAFSNNPSCCYPRGMRPPIHLSENRLSRLSSSSPIYAHCAVTELFAIFTTYSLFDCHMSPSSEPPSPLPLTDITPSAISLPTFSTPVIEVTHPIWFVRKTDLFPSNQIRIFSMFLFSSLCYIIYILKELYKKKKKATQISARTGCFHCSNYFFFLVNTVFRFLFCVLSLSPVPFERILYAVPD